MNFFKNKKKLILGISIDIFVCILAFFVILGISKKDTVKTSSLNISTNNTTNINDVETNNVITVVLENTPDEYNPEKEIPELDTDKKTSDKELKEEKVTKKEEKKSNSPYYIKVNYSANVVTVYSKDKDGKYTVPYKAMICSCGTYTPKSGTYKISSKYRWGKLIHDVYGQYATRIVGKILFHSVPYSSNQNDTLLYNQYDKLGTTASAGCIRLSVADAKWIYDNCPSGTMVEFYKDSNPGPLGKPSAQKISSVEECRNWDPTDPMSGNPWHTYVPETESTVPDTPTADIPTTDVPDIDTPTTDEPSIDVPATEGPSTDKPSADIPTTGDSSTDVPSTDEPTTGEPNTDKPSADIPTTGDSSTDVPSTDEPTTGEPNTDKPSADIPTTGEPSTDKPNTDAPTTDGPNTVVPDTDEPSTDVPTTDTSSPTPTTVEDNI